MFEIKTEQGPNSLRLGLVHHQLLVLDVVAERRQPAHPHSFLLGGRDLVADTLRRDLALELGKGEQHVQREPAHGSAGVELLGHRDKRYTCCIEHIDDLGEVGERSRQPVDLVDDDQIDFALLDVDQKGLQCRAFQRAPRKPAVIIAF